MAGRTGLKLTRRRVWDDGWRLPDALWAKMEPLLPPRPKPPLGCHNPRVPDRAAMDAIFFVLRTGCQWNALGETGICSSSSAHRRFQEWIAAGVFEAFWRTHALMAPPLPLRPDPLGQEARQLPRAAPLRARHHHMATRSTGIGSKAQSTRALVQEG